MMFVEVKCLAALREQLGTPGGRLELPVGATVADAWAALTQAVRPPAVLMAVNWNYCNADKPLNDGDEVAFFPPVTGG